MKIEIKKFKRIENKTLTVPVTIEGGNGVGKSTILEAISFVLTGKTLAGKEFAQVYDNRVDLHDAIADVSYFDDFGNEYNRKVVPIYETSRAGVESLKILRATNCSKNGIDCNDFSSEFEDFYKFGTDFFFSQKETDQRSVFIDLMKSLLPDYDVKDAQLRLVSLKKSQKKKVQEIKDIRAMLKELTDKQLPEISAELQKNEAEYQNIFSSISDNQKEIELINIENNRIQNEFRSAKSAIESTIVNLEADLKTALNTLNDADTEISELENKALITEVLTPIENLKAEKEKTEKELNALTYYSELSDFGKANYLKNEIVRANITKIKDLAENGSDEVTDVCSACGEKSEAAFKKSLAIQIDAIKKENRDLLAIDMRESNNAFFIKKDELTRLTAQLNSIETENENKVKRNKAIERTFLIDRTNAIDKAKKVIEIETKKSKELGIEIANSKTELSELREPVLKEIPTALLISDELKAAHSEFAELQILINKAAGVNENNAEVRSKKEVEIKENQIFLADLDQDVVKLEQEISDYFKNLDGIVAKEFAGTFEIGVKLQEYVITKKEYKDCFKITADGNVFPHECNGAFVNNIKLQVLSALQRLKGYKGITIMDNSEANTTQELNHNGLNLVVAKATQEKTLKIISNNR